MMVEVRAYNSIPVLCLGKWPTLRANLLRVKYSIFSYTYKLILIAVKAQSEISKCKEITADARQGCSLSQLLFITYI
jgi:hypothetical protein